MNDSSNEWKLYICRACGFIYNEEEGDPDSGLVPGTRFEDIPDDWECPLCGVKKMDFEPFERPTIDANAATFKTKHSDNPGVIVIGAGTAGWSTVEAIRQNDTQIPVTMITACKGDVYHKPELSLAIARQMTEKKLIREKGVDAAKRLAINLLANTYVVGLSPKLKMVRTTRGTFHYADLVLAQGAQNQLPNGIPAAWCWRINHLGSWSGLRKKLENKVERIAIVGGGMVGCELAENLSLAGHQVSLIYRSETPLHRLLPTNAGKRFAAYLDQQAVQCINNATVKSVEQNKALDSDDQVSQTYDLTLTNGDALTVDHIITAAGLKTDQRLPNMAGLDYENGIVVNSATLETSEKHIYALGDCISLAGQACRFIAPISRQAKVISAKILNLGAMDYEHEVPTIRLKVQACSLVLHGQPTANAEWKTINDKPDTLTMEQWAEGEMVSRLELAKVS